MKSLISSFIGLVLSVSVSAEPLIEGRVRLDSGAPVADAQVRIFDMSNLRQGAIARATTDGTGYFALPLAALTERGVAAAVRLGSELPQSVQSLDDHSLSTGGFVPSAAGGVQPVGAAYCDVGQWGAVGRVSHGDVARHGCGRAGGRSRGVHLPDDGGGGESGGADGAD